MNNNIYIFNIFHAYIFLDCWRNTNVALNYVRKRLSSTGEKNNNKKNKTKKYSREPRAQNIYSVRETIVVYTRCLKTI